MNNSTILKDIEAGQAALDEIAVLRKKDADAFERLAARQEADETAESTANLKNGNRASAASVERETDAQTFARLAALPAADYDRQREDEAARMGIRVGTLDAEVKRLRSGADPQAEGNGSAFGFEDPEPWPDPVDGAALLDELAASVRRYVVLPAGAAEALALWAVHTHSHDAAQVSPIAAISSPTHGCGKSTLLAWLGAVVPKPLPASNITTAALFRAVEKWRPTMLVDEADTFLGASDDLRGIINSGHARANAFVIRTVGEDHEPRAFSTWAPKAIAMIGKMHPTLASRSIVIELRRKGAGEAVEPLRPSHHADLDVLRRKAARWAADNHDRLSYAEPDMPDGLINRCADNWTALLSIAAAAGGDWPQRARKAAVTLGADRNDESYGAVLLGDLRAIFAERKTSRMASIEIVTTLTAMEDRPWPEWRDGRPLTPRQLAKLLEPFGIRPGARRDGEVVFKGYTRESFSDAFARYLVPPAVTESQASTGAVLRDSVSVTQSGAVTDAKTAKSSTGAVRNPVTDSVPETRVPGASGACGPADVPDVPAETRLPGTTGASGPSKPALHGSKPPVGRPCTAAEYAAKEWGDEV